MPYVKSEAPPDVLDVVRKAEAQADDCWRALQIRYFTTNLATWAVLTGGIKVVEGEQTARGSNTPHFDAMLANLSRLLAVAVKWTMQYGQPAADLNRRWTGELSAAVDQTVALAKQFSHFEVCFQGFHKGRYAAEVLSPGMIRFSVPGTERDRQVSAYQKGLRPREGRFAGQRAAQRPQEARVVDAFDQVLRACRLTGSLCFEYADPWNLWRELVPEYRDRVIALARRADTLSLGDYTLGIQFRLRRADHDLRGERTPVLSLVAGAGHVSDRIRGDGSLCPRLDRSALAFERRRFGEVPCHDR